MQLQDFHQPKNTEYEREGDTFDGIGAEFTSAKTIQETNSQDSQTALQNLQISSAKNDKVCARAERGGGEAGFIPAETIHLNIECIFFENGKCAIYPVRPKQCRDFPFWESHKILDADSKKALSLECKGITFFS
ncbi:YkgJ family cysteine cluster protein [Helicobacter sp. MIT 00-7814]|uniref:YkgJ family cysteine cluster protein n=1 Tax=unclassified Helicobacter TaxID=2593540 RepID=UPI0038D1CFC8